MPLSSLWKPKSRGIKNKIFSYSPQMPPGPGWAGLERGGRDSAWKLNWILSQRERWVHLIFRVLLRRLERNWPKLETLLHQAQEKSLRLPPLPAPGFAFAKIKADALSSSCRQLSAQIEFPWAQLMSLFGRRTGVRSECCTWTGNVSLELNADALTSPLGAASLTLLEGLVGKP